ncbi:axoneme-associated protein mst101(2)-like [Drosophila innubila]|uniref:axoneme-associated protein mst101(2)-like n=1 Tax=Drosophila innubila TaxID=198719 RepID=UPI00148E22B6|nr:axoneme-associated protein mst101(2)-like [Drosophila innubila]
MTFSRITNIFSRKSLLRGFSVLADSVNRLYQPHTSLKSPPRVLYSQGSDSGASDKKKKNPCYEYKKILDKRRKEKEKKLEEIRKGKDMEVIRELECKCINDEVKAWEKEAKSLSKNNKELMEELMQCVSRGIKRACKKSAKRKFCNEKKLEKKCILRAKGVQINKLIRRCESKEQREKIGLPLKEKKYKSIKKKSVKKKVKDRITNNSEMQRNNTSNNTKKMKRNSQSGIPSNFKNPYILELEKCIENEWKDLCTFRKSLTKSEQERLARAYNCLAAQFRKMCKRKVLEQMCRESGTRVNKDTVDIRKNERSLTLEVERQKKKLKEEVQRANSEVEAFIKHEVDNVKRKCLKRMCEEAELIKKCDEEALKKLCREKNNQRKEEQRKRKCQQQQTQKIKDLKKKREEEKRKKKWEAIILKKRRDEDLKRKCEEEALKKRCEEKALQRKRREEALRKKLEEESIKKKEEALKKKQKDAALKKRKLEEALKKKQEEALKKEKRADLLKKMCEKKTLEKKCKVEALKKRCRGKTLKKKCDEEALNKKCEEEALKKKCEEETLKQKCEEEALKKKCEEQTLKKCEEEALKKKRQEEALKKNLREEALKKKQEKLALIQICRELKNKRKEDTIRKRREQEKIRKDKALLNKCKQEERLMKWEGEVNKKKLKEEKLKKVRKEKALKKECEDKEKCRQKELRKRKLEETLKEPTEHFRCCLFKTLKKHDIQSGSKVSIIGTGAVGMACAITLLSKNITNHITLYDTKKELCEGERLDLIHGSLFLDSLNIEKSTTIKSTKDSRVVVVTAGARRKPNESRLDVAQKTANIIKQVMPELVKQSPKASFLIVSNPTDVMTWLARKVTDLPFERCFSPGCHLDTARFRMLIARMLRVSTQSVNGYIIGEHGDSSVPLWSTVTVGGIPLNCIHPDIGNERDPMCWSNVHMEVVNAAKKVSNAKGYTNWAIALTVTDIISAILQDTNSIMSLSTNAKGMCSIEDEVFLSLPCIVNKWGLRGVIHPQLSEWEIKSLHKSAEILLEAQCNVKL